ncbi:MAG: hypothetical protein A3K10_03875 [Bacteroidetes bacterium RIFCSPLOWO2_12_FULL_31_6]|nr:MAG: hypothetical protein A3K10_03875 [Bacteroidetes bacterium RIFCSPLOWO2_12_FULL_31_6]
MQDIIKNNAYKGNENPAVLFDDTLKFISSCKIKTYERVFHKNNATGKKASPMDQQQTVA